MSVGDAFWFLIIQIDEKIAPRRFGHIVGITLIVKNFRGTNYISCPLLLAHHEMGIANEKEILQGIGDAKASCEPLTRFILPQQVHTVESISGYR